MAYSLKGLLNKTPLSAKIVIILIGVSTLIGMSGASIYADRKQTKLEEEIALELAQAGARIQKDLAETDRLTPAVIRKKLSFLSVFPYVKCAEFSVNGKPKGAWPIPLCKPMLKKLNTQPVITEKHKDNQLIFHIDRDFVANAIKTEQITFMLIMGTMLSVLSSILIGIMFIMVSMPLRPLPKILRQIKMVLSVLFQLLAGLNFAISSRLIINLLTMLSPKLTKSQYGEHESGMSLNKLMKFRPCLYLMKFGSRELTLVISPCVSFLAIFMKCLPMTMVAAR